MKEPVREGIEHHTGASVESVFIGLYYLGESDNMSSFPIFSCRLDDVLGGQSRLFELRIHGEIAGLHDCAENTDPDDEGYAYSSATDRDEGYVYHGLAGYTARLIGHDFPRKGRKFSD